MRPPKEARKELVFPWVFLTRRPVIIETVLNSATNNGPFGDHSLLAGSIGVKATAECEETKVFNSNEQG